MSMELKKKTTQDLLGTRGKSLLHTDFHVSFCFVSETGSYCVVLEAFMKLRLASTQRSSCLCSAVIKGVAGSLHNAIETILMEETATQALSPSPTIKLKLTRGFNCFEVSTNRPP